MNHTDADSTNDKIRMPVVLVASCAASGINGALFLSRRMKGKTSSNRRKDIRVFVMSEASWKQM
jgi:hypothetical protein